MSNHMTPKQAQDLIRDTTPGPWAAIHNYPYVSIVMADDEDDIHAPVADITDGTDEPEVHANHELMAAAPDLARTLAGDILEYRVEHKHIDNGFWHPLTKWSPEWPLNDGHSVAPDERVVCRRVSALWEVTDE